LIWYYKNEKLQLIVCYIVYFRKGSASLKDQEEHVHEHNHHHKERKQVFNRLARIEGHVRSVKQMTLDGRDCPDLLLQIAAIRKALDGVAKVILKDHLEECVTSSLDPTNRERVLKDLQLALDHFIR
jgi:DNA-binding FrmR family transcriptional regulator